MRRIKIKHARVEGTIFAEAESTFIRLEADNERAGFHINGKPHDFKTVVHNYNDGPRFNEIRTCNKENYYCSSRYSDMLIDLVEKQVIELFANAEFMETGRIKRLKQDISYSNRTIAELKRDLDKEIDKLRKLEQQLKPQKSKTAVA